MNAPDHIKPEKLLSVLFESPNATAVYSGADIKILSANGMMLKFWGKDRSVVGKNFIDAIPELKDQPFLDILKNVWNTGVTYFAKDTPATLKIDGKLQEFYFDFEYKAILNDEGKTEFILHTAFEVSERMTAWQMVEEKSIQEQKLNEELRAINEEYVATNQELMVINEELSASEEHLSRMIASLNESEKRFRTMIEQSPVAITSLKGKDLVIDAVNDMMLRLWGKDRSVVGLPLHLALSEERIKPFIGILKNVYITGESYYGKEHKIDLQIDGETRECYINFVYQRTDNSSEEKSILIVANDVTEQVVSKKEMDEVNTRLQIALDAGGLGSTEVNLITGKMTSTDQFKRNYGFSPNEEFAYNDLFEAMLPEHRERIKNLVLKAIKTNGIYKAEYPVRWKDGSLHWIEAHGRPRYNEEGVADRMVGVNVDITEKKLFEQRKDDFLSIASHELKTPLTALKASLQLLDRLKSKPFSETHLKLIEQSVKSVVKMSEMVDSLLNVRRLSEGQLKVEKAWFNLHEMLLNSCSHVRAENKYNLILEGDSTIEVFADEHRIDQVVINLVNNAVKYASESMQILITTEVIEDYVKISVADYGKGIEQNKLSNLFDRYYRADYSGKAYSGLGLGLYICSEIIEKHEGEMGVESEIDKGSTFWFTLPLYKK